MSNSSDVKIIRITSGEEIIATVIDNESNVTLKDPAVLIPSPEGKLLLARWLPYADIPEGVSLEKKNILFVVSPQEQLKDHYINVVVNNLVVPSKKIVNPLDNSNLKLTV
jgi:hypothetical protein